MRPESDHKEEMEKKAGLDGFLGFLLRTEKVAQIKPRMDDQLYVTENMRAILVDWMSELCYNYSLHRVTFHISVLILDRYISTDVCIKRSEFQTLGAVCVMVATKLCVGVDAAFHVGACLREPQHDDPGHGEQLHARAAGGG